MLNELPLEAEEGIPSVQDTETINKDIEKLKEAVNGLELVSLISKESDLKGQLTMIQAKIDSLCNPWDTALIALIDRLFNEKKSLKQKPAKLEKFVQRARS